jgi:hypothetical protein
MKDITIIGKSKAALNLAHYLDFIGIKYNLLEYRKSGKSQNIIKDSKIIFILTRDDEIINFYNKNLDLIKGKKLYHFSGALFHKNIVSLHPIISFSKKLLSKKDFEEIIFTSENPERIRKELLWFKNKIIKIKPKDKPYYHCLLNILFNFPPLLFKSISDDLINKFNLPKEYIDKRLKDVIERYIDDPEFVGGPLERGDRKTVAAHLKALSGKRLFYIYEGFLKYYHQKDKRYKVKRSKSKKLSSDCQS